jgi:ABC-type dipeptide/oligopeptide/nickel transport system permease subunit
MAGQGGGGAFVLFYLIFLVILGLPIMTMEFAVGRASKKSPVKAYQALEKPGQKWHIHGYFTLAGCYLLMMFYTTVAGWMLHYFYMTAAGKLSGLSADAVAEQFTRMLADPGVMMFWMVLVVIIGIAEWPQYARTVRASVLAEKKKEYVEAAQVMGFRAPRIMFRHILPNCLSPILVISTVQVANAIMSEAALSFLGLGMPVDQPSLGSLISVGFNYIFSGSWWITAFPGLCLVVLVLVINLLGDWLRDVLTRRSTRADKPLHELAARP